MLSVVCSICKERRVTVASGPLMPRLHEAEAKPCPFKKVTRHGADLKSAGIEKALTPQKNQYIPQPLDGAQLKKREHIAPNRRRRCGACAESYAV